MILEFARQESRKNAGPTVASVLVAYGMISPQAYLSANEPITPGARYTQYSEPSLRQRRGGLRTF